MVRPPAGRPPPPPPGGRPRPPPPPPRKTPPPPPPKTKPPPPPPRTDSNPSPKRAVPPAAAALNAKRSKLSIMAPVVLRDVNVFEKKYQVGQGTYGSVFVGQDKLSNEIVALKRINTKQEENGFPITALREVKILKALRHPNIVTLKEIVTSKEQGSIPNNVFMVFEYLEYDLTGVLETSEIRFTQDHVKSWAHQLLLGTHYMHTNKVIHRDLKASNLLINKQGQLKIADWGLARSWNADMKRLTNKVITLWYRPPELLLGCSEYTDKIDMWSVGCIIAEMFRRSGFLKGSNEATQLDLIFRTFGHPTDEDWPDMKKKCKLWPKFAPGPGEKILPSRLREALTSQLPNPKWMTDHAIYLLQKLLEMNPDKRWTAEQSLDADYFFEHPIVKTPDKLSMKFAVNSVHEWDCRKKYEQKIKQQQQRAAAAAATQGPK
eukprot:CAMPEP_0172445062 /NCGR_PEP_ID=MMETSP1065-20121228/5033_1 /TAXON_ID=265537 /ORGANISM="Amphiprora paludosa, Strain CCMP125" /LENGTH=433 /DNA_ID=CAMNT_0013195857 /DNA_START=744 /DNA_END=2045 /DNA_ORIENTATION=-